MILLHQILSEIPYSQGTEIANFSYDSSVRNNCPFQPFITYVVVFYVNIQVLK